MEHKKSVMDAEQEVISNLKFISMVKKNEKINTQFMYIQKNSIFTRFARTFINPDNRYNTLTFLQRTVNNTFQILERYKKSKRRDEQHVRNIIKDLYKARIGLTNIQETYTDDLKFRCDITTLIETIENRVPLEDYEQDIKNSKESEYKDMDDLVNKSDDDEDDENSSDSSS